MEMTKNIEADNNTNPPLRFAGFWMRFWAYTLDIIIVWCINGILLSPLKFFDDAEQIGIGFWSLATVVSTIVLFLYFLIVTKLYGQTIGKMILGLKVVRQDDYSLGWKDVLFREIIGRFLHRAFTILLLLYLVVAFDTHKQGIHDKIGDTCVIHEQ